MSLERRYSFWPIAVAVLVFSEFLYVEAASAQVYAASLEELAETSSSVVFGKAVASRSFWNEDRTQIHTEVTIDVEEPISGAAETRTVITIPGGRVGNTLYEVSDMPVFVDGEEVVVFLWQDPSGRMLVTGGSQGKLTVFRDKTAGGLQVAEPPQPQAEKIGSAEDRNERRTVPLEQLIRRVKQLRNE